VKQENAANAAPLPTHIFYPEASERSYYIDALLEQLEKPNPFDPTDPANLLGTTPAMAKKRLYEGGLRIYTNYDPGMQYAADLAIAHIIPTQNQFTAALVSIDNSNGAVRAVAFGSGYDASQFDPAVDGPGRQAGSSFKGITLATALANGYSPNDRVSGSDLRWRLGPGNDASDFYNLSGDCHGGDPTLTQAIAASDNCAYVRTELSLGPGNYGHDGASKVIAMASKMGVNTTHFSPVVSTTLGTNGVHPLEMAEAYSVIAADGVLHPAEFVSKIVGPTGQVLYKAPTAGTRVLTAQNARTETQMLTEVLKNGTAAGLSIGRPAAGKTGTTDHNQDAWFIGYTPQLTTAVWMGDPNAETSMNDVGGIQVFGATYPAHVWAAFMEAALAKQPIVDFAQPIEALWPRAEQIDEQGRGFHNYFEGGSPTTTTLPVVAPTTVPKTHTTTPRSGPPTTPPPVTVPRTTPRTTPPTAPPTTPPTAPPPTTGP
jgi:penicillin-binding protein 1A